MKGNTLPLAHDDERHKDLIIPTPNDSPKITVTPNDGPNSSYKKKKKEVR